MNIFIKLYVNCKSVLNDTETYLLVYITRAVIYLVNGKHLSDDFPKKEFQASANSQNPFEKILKGIKDFGYII